MICFPLYQMEVNKPKPEGVFAAKPGRWIYINPMHVIAVGSTSHQQSVWCDGQKHGEPRDSVVEREVTVVGVAAPGSELISYWVDEPALTVAKKIEEWLGR